MYTAVLERTLFIHIVPFYGLVVVFRLLNNGELFCVLLPSHLVDEVLPLSQQIKDNAEILETYLFNLSSVPTCIRRDTVEVSHVFFSPAIFLVFMF